MEPVTLSLCLKEVVYAPRSFHGCVQIGKCLYRTSGAKYHLPQNFKRLDKSISSVTNSVGDR